MCIYAERLRNIALVSISRELRTLAKRRKSDSGRTDPSLRRGPNVTLLRSKTDEDRKALQDHLSNCRRCRSTENASELEGSQQLQVQEG